MLINLGPEWKDRWINPAHIVDIFLDRNSREIYIKMTTGATFEHYVNNDELCLAEFERVIKLINGGAETQPKEL